MTWSPCHLPPIRPTLLDYTALTLLLLISPHLHHSLALTDNNNNNNNNNDDNKDTTNNNNMAKTLVGALTQNKTRADNNNNNNDNTNTNKTVTLAVILPENNSYPWSLPKTRDAVDLALDSVRRQQLLPGWTLQADFRDSKCSETQGPLEAVEAYYRYYHYWKTSSNNTAFVFLGPVCNFAAAPVARFATHWGIPVLTAGALVKAFDNKQEYSLLTRLISPYSQMGEFFVQIFKLFGWKKVGLLHHDNYGEQGGTRSECFFAMEALYDAVLRYTKTRPWYKIFDENQLNRTEDYVTIFQKAKLLPRILIMCARPQTIRELLIAADTLHFDDGDFVFFNIDLFASENRISAPWHREGDSEHRNTQAKKAFAALMTVTSIVPSSQTFLDFSDTLRKRVKQGTTHVYGRGHGRVNRYVSAFHDAVILYALALNETLEAGIPVSNGSDITQRMWNRTFEGVAGRVSINANGDRSGDYWLLDYQIDKGMAVIAQASSGGEKIHVNRINHSIVWPGGRSSPPTDDPACGLAGNKCGSRSGFPEYILVHIVLAGIVLLGLAAAFFFYRNIKVEAELIEMNWRIPIEQVSFGRRFSQSFVGLLTRRTTPPVHPTWSETNGSSSNSSSSSGSSSSVTPASPEPRHSVGEQKPIFPRSLVRANYKGRAVVVKPLKGSSMDIERPALEELKVLRSMNCEHINQFVGVCIDSPTPIMLTEYCAKGSLKDMLENRDIKLDFMFRFYLMQDIVRGLAYLHNSELHSHGNLTSSNCVLDRGFVLKLTDFDLKYLRYVYPEDRDNRDWAWYRRQLWTAPELLRGSEPRVGGTQEGDVYSLAIICQEIVYRKGVFYLPDQQDFTPDKIYSRVKAGCLPVLRPPLDLLKQQAVEEQEGPLGDSLTLLITSCWDEDPFLRPTASKLMQTMRELSPGHKGEDGVVGSMLARMELYADTLEEQVTLKTKDYLEEKQRAQDLLYSMLPVSVAQSLIRGHKVMAEYYESVTIYFSDIQNFTVLSASSTPMEVVTLLNDLYTNFDSVLELYDVYKVETIGDAYMVVSGLPQPNGDLHAKAIARMSLDLLKNVSTFTIRHRPDEKLQLRMGIHSGPVVAGVVGMKMPRYCLFGDTVNTASRMESNGMPLKVHISQQTKDILDKFGTFTITLRGNLTVKGKGVMTTYWLLGECIGNRPYGSRRSRAKSLAVSDGVSLLGKPETLELPLQE